MRFFDWLFGRVPAESNDVEGGPQPPPSWAGAGPDVHAGKETTKTERDLRKVQSQYDPATDSFRRKNSN